VNTLTTYELIIEMYTIIEIYSIVYTIQQSYTKTEAVFIEFQLLLNIYKLN